MCVPFPIMGALPLLGGIVRILFRHAMKVMKMNDVMRTMEVLSTGSELTLIAGIETHHTFSRWYETTSLSLLRSVSGTSQCIVSPEPNRLTS